jgi:hypothetical protein
MSGWMVLAFLVAATNDMKENAISADRWEKLAAEFRDPPMESRPMLRWWWFGGAVSDDELARQLKAMNRQGFGGVEIQPVYPLALDDHSGAIKNLPYLSEEFCARLRSAVEKAHELGMRVDLTLGSGWPFGGPHIRPDQRARKISLHETPVSGPGVFERAANPDAQETDRLVAVFAVPANADSLIPSDIRDLNSFVSPSGIIRWEIPSGNWKALVAIESDTGQQVKRPTVGAEGYVHDHYSFPALKRHLDVVGDKLLSAVGRKQNVGCLFCDSWEVFGSNWTSDFLGEFERRRGYDLKPLLPFLWGENLPAAASVRYDFRKTLSDLALERFFRPLAGYCESRGLCARIQAHGTPADTFLGYAAADIPEGESFGGEGDQWAPEIAKRRTASSAAHLFGKPICSAEAYTWLRRPRYCTTLEQMKAASDVFFLDGINQIVGHGFPYSPRKAARPGWNFYAATMINTNNTWWPYVRHLTEYVSRVSHLLRQGTWVADVLIYLPSGDTWSKPFERHLSSSREWGDYVGSELLRTILASGFNFDVVNDEVLQKRARLTGRSLAVGNQSYRILILPSVRRIPPETLAAIADFCRAGGVVIAWKTVPESACSYLDFDDRSRRVRDLADSLFGPSGPPSAFQLSDFDGLTNLLRTLQPDVLLDPPKPEVGFIHREIAGSHVYFLANVSPNPTRAKVTFRAAGVPVLWDAATGEHRPAGNWLIDESGTQVDLVWDPFESKIIIIRPAGEVPSALHLRTNFEKPSVRCDGSGCLVEGSTPRAGKCWAELSGESGSVEVPAPPGEVLIEGPWKIAAPEFSRLRNLTDLMFWTELPDLRYFSGSGVYATEFAVSGEVDLSSVEAELDLGEVHEVAEVWVNGSHSGTTWHRPHRVNITEALRNGENRLRIVVTNLLINQVLGMPDPDYSELEEVYGRRFPAPGEKSAFGEPLPSGLLGPVRIRFRNKVQIQLKHEQTE